MNNKESSINTSLPIENITTNINEDNEDNEDKELDYTTPPITPRKKNFETPQAPKKYINRQTPINYPSCAKQLF